MKTYPPVPARSWLWTCLLLIMYAGAMERATSAIGDWVSKQGLISWLGFALIPVAIGLAGFLAASLFMRKFGYGQSIRKRLIIYYPVSLLIWAVLSVAIRFAIAGANLADRDQLVAVLIVTALDLAETGAGCLLVVGAIIRTGRRYESFYSKRALASVGVH